MKILLLQDDFPPNAHGGAGVIAASHARGYARMGHEVVVLCAVQRKSDPKEYLYENARVVCIYSAYHPRWRAWRSLYNPSTVAALKRLLKEFKPDLVHAHNIHEHLSYYALPVARRSGARLVLTAHDAMMVAYDQVYPVRPVCGASYRENLWKKIYEARWRFNPLRNLVIRACVQSCHRVVAVSRALGDFLTEEGISNISVLHNGIEADLWHASSEQVTAFKERLGLSDKKVIFFATRFNYAKGASQALACIEQIRKQLPKTILLVASKHSEQRPGVVSAGWLSEAELANAYYASDVVITPSLYLDPFPTVNLEAMACGKPIVATCFGGSKEAVEDGVTGYVRNPYDPEVFAEAIIDLLNNPKKAQKFGETARARAKKEFSLEERIQKLLELYKVAW